MVYGERVKNCSFFSSVSLLESSSELIVLDRCYKQWPCLVDFFFLSSQTHTHTQTELEEQINYYYISRFGLSTMLLLLDQQTCEKREEASTKTFYRKWFCEMFFLLSTFSTSSGISFCAWFIVSQSDLFEQEHEISIIYQPESQQRSQMKSELNWTNDFCLQSKIISMLDWVKKCFRFADKNCFQLNAKCLIECCRINAKMAMSVLNVNRPEKIANHSTQRTNDSLVKPTRKCCKNERP